MEASGKFVGALPELTASMEVGQYQLNSRHLKFRMRLDRNAAPVVTDRSRAINMDGDVNLGTEPCQVFVNRVVQDFKDTVM